MKSDDLCINPVCTYVSDIECTGQVCLNLNLQKPLYLYSNPQLGLNIVHICMGVGDTLFLTSVIVCREFDLFRYYSIRIMFYNFARYLFLCQFASTLIFPGCVTHRKFRNTLFRASVLMRSSRIGMRAHIKPWVSCRSGAWGSIVVKALRYPRPHFCKKPKV